MISTSLIPNVSPSYFKILFYFLYTKSLSNAVVQIAMNRVAADARNSVTEIILQSKSTIAQKRALLLKKGLPRSTVDELEILSEVG